MTLGEGGPQAVKLYTYLQFGHLTDVRITHHYLWGFEETCKEDTTLLTQISKVGMINMEQTK